MTVPEIPAESSSRGACRRHLILFDSVHFVLAAERLLKSRGCEVSVRSTPRSLSSDCGVCLEVSGAGLEKVRGELGRSRLQVRGIHPEPGGEGGEGEEGEGE